MKSIICNDRVCFKCGTTLNLHKHHVINGTANRKISDEDGLWVYLCAYHHNGSNDSVHYNKEFALELKQIAEKRWIEFYGKDKESFIKRYGRNYL